MSDIVNENGDLVWYAPYSFFENRDIIYRHSTTSQVGKVVDIRYRHIPHLDHYAADGKKTVEQEVLIRWLRPATRKRLGKESWHKSQGLNSLSTLIESHERKASKFRKDLLSAGVL